jgi:hypothetical protein
VCGSGGCWPTGLCVLQQKSSKPADLSDGGVRACKGSLWLGSARLPWLGDTASAAGRLATVLDCPWPRFGRGPRTSVASSVA